LLFGHNIPDSRKMFLIRFFTVIICAKNFHCFNFLICFDFWVQSKDINTNKTSKCYKNL